MSCALAAAALMILSDPNGAAPHSVPDPVPAAAPAPASVADEPLFAEIVTRAGALKAIVDGWAASGAAEAPGFANGPDFADLSARAGELAALNLRGHLALAERGTDGDLKCILRGVSEDMPGRVTAVATAETPAARAEALAELSHLLDDNQAVILAPPQPPV